jgi:hypothetical protein
MKNLMNMSDSDEEGEEETKGIFKKQGKKAGKPQAGSNDKWKKKKQKNDSDDESDEDESNEEEEEIKKGGEQKDERKKHDPMA